MKIFGKERLCYLLKVFEKEKYRNEFIEGNLYLNSSGYFNELDNKHRGDKYDGKKIQFNTEISINGSMYNAKSIVSGFIGDDKIPILCATILDELVLEEKYLDCFILKNKIKEELTKFGKYGLLFLYGELHDNLKTLDDFVKFDQGKVNYVEIGNQEYYNLLKENSHNLYNKFFIKDISYFLQNEFRIIFLSNNKDKFTPLIPKNNNFFRLKVPSLKAYINVDMEQDAIRLYLPTIQ